MSNILIFLIVAVLGQDVLFAAEIRVPMEQEGWYSVPFKKVKPNEVQFAGDSIEVSVDASASPLVFRLDGPMPIVGFRVAGIYSGQKNKERSRYDDDSILRVGLVGVGKKRLMGVASYLSAAWIKLLYAMTPPESGLDKLYFFSLTNRAQLVGKTNRVLKTDLVQDVVLQKIEDNGEYLFTHTFDEPIEASALWLSVDGEKTRSKFKNTLNEIVLITADKHQETNRGGS